MIILAGTSIQPQKCIQILKKNVNTYSLKKPLYFFFPKNLKIQRDTCPYLHPIPLVT